MIRFESGDFPEGSIGQIKERKLRILGDGGKEITTYNKIEHVEKLDSQAKTNWGRKAAVGVTAGVLTGGIGLVAGGLLAGNNKEMVLLIKFPDGKSAVGVGSNKDYDSLLGLIETGWGLSVIAFLIVVGIPMAIIISCVT